MPHESVLTGTAVVESSRRIPCLRGWLYVMHRNDFFKLNSCETWLDDLGTAYVPVTISIFAQMIIYANADVLPEYLPFGTHSEDVWAAYALVGSTGPALNIIQCTNPTLRRDLEEAGTDAFRNFVLGPHEDGTYLGLDELGPIRMPYDVWVTKIREASWSHLATALENDNRHAAMHIYTAEAQPLGLFTQPQP